ncbi:MAG: phage baseplate assembly protein V [bacterium]
MKQFSKLFQSVVIDNVDPENRGRVKVLLPSLGEPKESGRERWARIVTLMAGNNRGTWFIPDVNDEVLVAFEGGDKGDFYVIGCLWSSVDSPPETMAAGNNRKLLLSRSGLKVTLDDKSGEESFLVETPGGQRLRLKDGPGSIKISDSNGNDVRFEPSGIHVNASAKITIAASQVQLDAGMISINAGMSKFNGVLQCDTLISNSVISASYSPGAGNVL